jgi:DNA-binding transcriptional ArsR family regulator
LINDPDRLTGAEVVYNQLVMERIAYESRGRDLDAVFAALADPTRRAILSRLAGGEASVNEIAAPFEISQPAVSRHLKVLEQAGLIERDVDRQRRPARLKAEPMAAAVRWLEEFKQFWSSSFDQLDDLLEELKKAEKKGRRK